MRFTTNHWPYLQGPLYGTYIDMHPEINNYAQMQIKEVHGCVVPCSSLDIGADLCIPDTNCLVLQCRSQAMAIRRESNGVYPISVSTKYPYHEVLEDPPLAIHASCFCPVIP